MRGVAAMVIAWGGLLVAGCFFDPQGSVTATEAGGTGSTGGAVTSGVGSTGDATPTTGGATSGTSGDASGDTGGDTSGDTSGDTGGAGVCGDAQLNGHEQCDNGELNNGKGGPCKGDCTLNVCGDGYVAMTEGCDDGNDNGADGCDQCMLASCGDGKIGPGEECDAGDANGGPACSKLCKLPVCGDGMVGAGEQCDAGGENSDTGMCTSKCTLAVCGDGLVLANVEACDDGNNLPGDGCEGCMAVVCGDGVIAGSEECDDGNNQVNDTCDASCNRLAFYIFATSKTFGGNLGGLDGADLKCTEAAATAELPGKYKAWLSDGQTSASLRLAHSTVAYVLPNMKVVASNWLDLTDGMLAHAIDVNEQKMSIFGIGGNCGKESLVWTGTAFDGAGTDPNCGDWQNQNQMLIGTVGNVHEADKDWSQICTIQCSNANRLYCVEQP